MFPTQIYMRKTRHHSTPCPPWYYITSIPNRRKDQICIEPLVQSYRNTGVTLTVRDLSVLEAARRSRWRRGRGGPRCWLHLRNSSDQTTADQQARRRSDPTWRLPSVYSVTSHTSQNNSNNKTKAVERSPRASTKVHVHFYPGIKLFLQQCANINMTLLT